MFISVIIICLMANLLLLKADKINHFLGTLLHVPSKKSTTGAMLLGGLPVFIGSAVVVALLTFNDSLMLLTWGVPAIFLVVAGYLDDRFELSALLKLTFQTLGITIFAVMAAFQSESGFDPLLLSVYLFWGLGVTNGSNLLDGIDTFTSKHSTVTYLFFALAGYSFNIPVLTTMAICFVAPMLVFYFFNRYPSKIHLGEIGGMLVGLNMLFLTFTMFKNFHTIQEFSGVKLIFALSFLHFPMTELGMSLLRRLYKGNSPFHGDKLHLHYLLSQHKGYGPVKTASILASLHLLCMGFNYTFMHVMNPIVAFFLSGACYVAYYLYLGYPYWSKEHGKNSKELKSYFPGLEENAIYVTDVSSLNHLSFDIDEYEYEEEKKIA